MMRLEPITYTRKLHVLHAEFSFAYIDKPNSVPSLLLATVVIIYLGSELPHCSSGTPSRSWTRPCTQVRI